MIQKLGKLLLLAIATHTAIIQGAELARVDDVVITTQSFAEALKALGSQGQMVAANPELRKRFLDHVINSQLVARKAKAEGFEKDPTYQARLADVTAQLLAGTYMDRTIEKQSTEAELKLWFDKNKELFSKKEVRAQHILCPDEATAKLALDQVRKSPKDFETIAKKYSKDKTVDLGFFSRGRMAAEFEDAAFKTPKGSLHDAPVKTNFGWHIIKVTDIKGDDVVKYESVKADVQKKYRQKLQEDLIHSLRQSSKISINEQNLKEVKIQ
jgi:peptidyl-prolyl cis-trans isomerase C